MRKRITDQSARDLLRQIVDRNERAFTEFYAAFSPEIFAFIVRRMDNSADAEDVKQDTFSAVWDSARSYSGGATVFSWVCGIAANKIPMNYRKRPKPTEDIDDLAPSDQPLSGDDSAEELIIKTQEKQGLTHCMGKLSFEHRECLFLAFWHDCSEQEMAEIQQIPRGTVKSRLSQARIKIKRCLARLLGDDKANGNEV